jgi:hypothetical protein
MARKGPEGSRIVAISPQTLPWAVSEVSRALSPAQVKSLKVPSGEHLAAILTTTFVGCAPVSIDTHGDPDLVFDLSACPSGRVPPESLGLGRERYADFEVKSLPGGWRKHAAAIDSALAAGSAPDQTVFTTVAKSANEVLRNEGRAMIAKAKAQLDKKSHDGHSKHVFLIAHLLDHLIVEAFDGPVIAHTLEPLEDDSGIDSVWILWAPSHLVVWSAAERTWTNLIFNGGDLQDVDFDDESGLDFLQQIEQHFLEQTSQTGGSPYVFGLVAAADRAEDLS